MNDRIFVKPARPDVKVRDDQTMTHVAPDGQWVQDSTYYRRRIADGDLVEAEAPQAQGEPASARRRPAGQE